MATTPITTHVLDLDRGKPAAGLTVYLYGPDCVLPLAMAKTNSEGRISQWDNALQLIQGSYTLLFAVGAWFELHQRASFYPEVRIVFKVENIAEHYHVPLLLNAYGYSTYRGS